MNMVASTNITVKLTVTTWIFVFHFSNNAIVGINSNWSYGLKEEGFEVVGHVGDDDEEQGGDVPGCAFVDILVIFKIILLHILNILK